MAKNYKSFKYIKTDKSYISVYKDHAWDDGQLQSSDRINIPISSTALHYGQTCFEGMKAYRRKDGHIQLFRPEDNARRFQESCERLVMPTIPVEVFVNAVKKTVLANESFVPDYGTNQTLYIRPFMIGVGDNVGVKPSPEYMFIIFVTPVGTYFEGPAKPVDMLVSSYDRAAPVGTGAAKVGGNYGASLLPKQHAKQLGFADCIFLDPKTHTKIEEAGTSNFFGISKDHAYITPTSPSILNSITNRSLKFIAKNMLNLRVEEKDIYIDDLEDIVEAGACGTAAVITPISSITNDDHKHVFPYHKEMGPTIKKLHDILTKIQVGDLPDPNNWITIIK
jgi:branched-chain amino acid aminotransferase